MRSSSSRNAGFTLLELKIVVSIIAILTAIALPSYHDYVIRGNLVDGTQQLAAYRAQMEQYFQDARSYADKGTAFKSPCDSPSTAYPNWTFSCNGTQGDAGYTWTASGVSGRPTSNFKFTIDQNNNQVTTQLPTGWGSYPQSCWITKKGGSC
jgi:type IV pilus assembly protein PilE